MILGFSTELNGYPTHFPEKILAGLVWEAEIANNLVFQAEISKYIKEYADFKNVHYSVIIDNIEELGLIKLHTLREDLNDRWQEGNRIHFFINTRKPNMFRFAPILRAKSIQEVFMTYLHSDLIQISIDGKELFGYQDRLKFAQNDGFNNWEDFFNYFYPKIIGSQTKSYKAKLIHWTDLKY